MDKTLIQQGFIMFESENDCRFQLRQISPDEAGSELERIHFDESYRNVAEKKFHHLIIKASGLSAPGANVLKQTCLSIGADAGVHSGAINCTIDREAVLITATQTQLEKLVQKLKPQHFGLKPLSDSITRMLQRQKHLGKTPLQVMAIINITPDSFSDGGKFNSTASIVDYAAKSLELGATILDIGGESSRPGSMTVSEEEEIKRVIPAIKALYQEFPKTCISIDTRKAYVAKAAIEAGASMVNDVSGLTFDPDMSKLIAKTGCKAVIMHSKGTPETMQHNPVYNDLLGEVSSFFYHQVAEAIKSGIDPERIILDPGFGFGKTVDHNLELMRRLPELVSIGFPILVGTSRKSFLTLGQDIAPNEREVLTAASLAVAVQAGARILRIHDVERHMPVIRWLQKMENIL